LKDKLISLALMSKASEALAEEMEKARDVLEMTESWMAYEAARAAHGELLMDIENLRSEIKNDAIEDYEQTGEKKPTEGVAIRIYRRVDYDPEIALEWCKQSLPKALKLDKSMLEKHLKAIQDTAPPEWVEYYEEPRPTISSDLSFLLEKGD
jgi:hypothetical protein